MWYAGFLQFETKNRYEDTPMASSVFHSNKQVAETQTSKLKFHLFYVLGDVLSKVKQLENQLACS